jgi:hypothetical protein
MRTCKQVYRTNRRPRNLAMSLIFVKSITQTYGYSYRSSLNSRRSSVNTVTRLRDGRRGFDFRQGQTFFPLRHRSQTDSEPYTASCPTGTGVFSPGENRSEREADHSPPSNTEGENAWSYTSTPPCVFMTWDLVEHKDNSNFTT